MKLTCNNKSAHLNKSITKYSISGGNQQGRWQGGNNQSNFDDQRGSMNNLAGAGYGGGNDRFGAGGNQDRRGFTLPGGNQGFGGGNDAGSGFNNSPGGYGGNQRGNNQGFRGGNNESSDFRGIQGGNAQVGLPGSGHVQPLLPQQQYQQQSQFQSPNSAVGNLGRTPNVPAENRGAGSGYNQQLGGSGYSQPQGGSGYNQPHGGSGYNQPQGGSGFNQPQGGSGYSQQDASYNRQQGNQAARYSQGADPGYGQGSGSGHNQNRDQLGQGYNNRASFGGGNDL